MFSIEVEHWPATTAISGGERIFFFFQAEDGIRDADVTGVQTCALPISYIKVGSPFQPDESAVQKLWYAVGVQAGILMWMEWYGNSTYQVSLVNNGGAFSNYTAGVPGATTRADGLTVLALGSWHRFEIRWRMPSSAGNDGHVIVWVDGNREIEADFFATPNDLFSELRLSCIWGGIHGTKTETDHIWYHHVIIATP